MYRSQVKLNLLAYVCNIYKWGIHKMVCLNQDLRTMITRDEFFIKMEGKFGKETYVH